MSIRAEQFLMRYQLPLACTILFLLPLRLSWSYIFLIPTLLCWVIIKSKELPNLFSKIPSIVIVPLLFWYAAAIFSSLFGLAPFRSLGELSSVGFYLLFLPFIYETAVQFGLYSLLGSALLGQAVAALHSLSAPYLMKGLQEAPIGPVTESGQLALLLPIGLGLLLSLFKNRSARLCTYEILREGIVLLLLGLLYFLPNHLSVVEQSLFLLIAIVATFMLPHCNHQSSSSKDRSINFVRSVFPILLATLIINLKRGPWLGVTVGFLVILLRFKKRFILPIVLLCTIFILFIPPVQNRIEDSYDHFVIAGGRQTMWMIGVELAAKYPLGIGFRNGDIMHLHDPDIPQNYDHFHNNLLTILVESGWLSAFSFLWWIFAVVRFGYQARGDGEEAILSVALATGILASQIAGLVEYNFGDSEIFLPTLAVTGCLAAIRTKKRDAEQKASAQ